MIVIKESTVATLIGTVDLIKRLKNKVQLYSILKKRMSKKKYLLGHILLFTIEASNNGGYGTFFK